ncbi:hypothetical protein B566_EDAN010361 [Ephemera danica]|nr:hypothetical protein B566_EDAN010361 [Ephemera danica]
MERHIFEAHVSIVRSEGKSKFCSTCEHAIRLVGTLSGQIINKNTNVTLSTTYYEGLPSLNCKRSKVLARPIAGSSPILPAVMSNVLLPILAEAAQASVPAWPPPTTMTSYELPLCKLRRDLRVTDVLIFSLTLDLHGQVWLCGHNNITYNATERKKQSAAGVHAIGMQLNIKLAIFLLVDLRGDNEAKLTSRLPWLSGLVISEKLISRLSQQHLIELPISAPSRLTALYCTRSQHGCRPQASRSIPREELPAAAATVRGHTLLNRPGPCHVKCRPGRRRAAEVTQVVDYSTNHARAMSATAAASSKNPALICKESWLKEKDKPLRLNVKMLRYESGLSPMQR